jgi:type VI protein secretion system component VasK
VEKEEEVLVVDTWWLWLSWRRRRRRRRRKATEPRRIAVSTKKMKEMELVQENYSYGGK